MERTDKIRWEEERKDCSAEKLIFFCCCIRQNQTNLRKNTSKKDPQSGEGSEEYKQS
jgi:hypothetical protein